MNVYRKKELLLSAIIGTEVGNRFRLNIDSESESEIVINLLEDDKYGYTYNTIKLVLSQSPYNYMMYYFGELDNIDKKKKILELFNSFNADIDPIKFFIDDNGSILGHMTYLSNDSFNGDDFIFHIIEFYKAIEENYYTEVISVM